jgi:hypothetical protein
MSWSVQHLHVTWSPLLSVSISFEFGYVYFADLLSQGQVSTIEKLFPELHLHLFKFLGPVSSVCLGLTCKKFYGIHWQLNGATIIYASEFAKYWVDPSEKDTWWASSELHMFLRTWMWNGAGLIWGGRYDLKFIVPARRNAEEREIKVLNDRGEEAKAAWSEKRAKLEARGHRSDGSVTVRGEGIKFVSDHLQCIARLDYMRYYNYRQSKFGKHIGTDNRHRGELRFLGLHDPGWQGIFEAELKEGRNLGEYERLWLHHEGTSLEEMTFAQMT